MIIVKAHKRNGKMVKAHSRAINKAKKNRIALAIGFKGIGNVGTGNPKKIAEGRAALKKGSVMDPQYRGGSLGVHQKINHRGGAAKGMYKTGKN